MIIIIVMNMLNALTIRKCTSWSKIIILTYARINRAYLLYKYLKHSDTNLSVHAYLNMMYNTITVCNGIMYFSKLN